MNHWDAEYARLFAVNKHNDMLGAPMYNAMLKIKIVMALYCLCLCFLIVGCDRVSKQKQDRITVDPGKDIGSEAEKAVYRIAYQLYKDGEFGDADVLLRWLVKRGGERGGSLVYSAQRLLIRDDFYSYYQSCWEQQKVAVKTPNQYELFDKESVLRAFGEPDHVKTQKTSQLDKDETYLGYDEVWLYDRITDNMQQKVAYAFRKNVVWYERTYDEKGNLSGEKRRLEFLNIFLDAPL